jgi:GDP-4-dehydro-6-deoxy-D-mannose reductase
MRVLVTGANGFVGHHLCRLLKATGDDVIAWDGPDAQAPRAGEERVHVVDIRNAQAVCDAMTSARPDAIVHLAAVSSVTLSHAEPAATFDVNTMGTLHLCVAAKDLDPAPRVVFVSSGEVYGPTAVGQRADEHSTLVPMSPYASSKVAAEALCFQFARAYNLHVVGARPFTHIGPGQSASFAIQSFARQLVAAHARGDRATTVLVGNLDPVRDFSHVSDVVDAYRLLLRSGVSGQCYNVCSGEGRAIRSVLDELAALCGIAINIQIDPARMRMADIPNLVGDASKLHALGWMPRRSVRDALGDILAECRANAA